MERNVALRSRWRLEIDEDGEAAKMED